MAKITKIKAKDPSKPQEKKVQPKTDPVKPVKKAEPPKQEAEKVVKKSKNTKKTKKPFVLFRPFCALGRYLRESWQEIRQVRWPSRKATWKMVLAVFVYSALFLVIIVLLDALFTFLFNLILA